MESGYEEKSKKVFWKEKIMPSLLGGLIGVILSQSVALYSLQQNTKFMINRERIGTLRSEIVRLKNVQTEFERNIKLLIEQGQFNFKYNFNQKIINLDMIKDPIVREFAKNYLGMSGTFYELSNVNIPKGRLSSTAYWPDVLASEVQFDISKELSDFYRRITRINGTIDEITFIIRQWGNIMREIDLQRLNELKTILEEDLKFISKDKIVELNSRVNNEIRRLEDMKAKLE